jgi:myosin-crossreactive antigen
MRVISADFAPACFAVSRQVAVTVATSLMMLRAAGLAAAFYLIRDGHMPAKNITVVEDLHTEGGSLDGAGDPEEGYIIRGGHGHRRREPRHRPPC